MKPDGATPGAGPPATGASPFGQGAAAIVAASLRRPRLTLLVSTLAGLLCLWAVLTRFALDTNVIHLFPEALGWRQAEIALDAAFPHRSDPIAVVVDAATPDLADRAAAALAAALEPRTDLFRSVTRPDADPYFRRSALLFLPLPEVRAATERIIAAQPLLGTLAADPSLRGVARTLELLAEGIARGTADPALLDPPLLALAAAAEAANAGRIAPLDWSRLFTGQPPDPLALRRFVLARPRLDFMALAPGGTATEIIRATAAGLGLTETAGIRVRLTGEVVMGDEEFASVFDGAIEENLLSLVSVGLLLWLGLRSGRLIWPMLGTLVLGLVATAAFGLVAIGPFNPLSIAFAVLFIGLGVDFGIQYAVCFREQRHRLADQPLEAALVAAAGQAGEGIALAALALCIGFLAFLPSDYRGVSELGLIASAGMVIAVLISLTTLPAWLRFARPKAERQPVGYAALAPLDRFLTGHARSVVAATVLVGLAAASCLLWLRFDSNPLNLRNPDTEAVATFRDLMRSPETTPNTLSALAPDLPAAEALARRLTALPEVAGTLTLADFIPADQPPKLALIHDAADLLGPTLEPPLAPPPPTDAEAAAALGQAAAALDRAPPDLAPPAAWLAAALRPLADGPPAAREQLAAALLPGLVDTLAALRDALAAAPITLADLPDTLRQDWIAADGRARVEIRPADLSDRTEAMTLFAAAVQAVAPGASGTAISVQASARTIRDAFIRAGAIATVLTVLLLLAALRSWRLALLALAPLVLAGLLTLAACALFGQPLNLANVIALPLLFAQGVAFDIYYVAAWRRGERSLLPSALTRAVLYSALTNGTAFGTLMLSGHPGTASMGLLLTLSLFFALAAVLLTLPAMLQAAAR